MLPKIDVPIYELKLISNGKKIKFRPFTVKEEKIFLMAMEAKDSKSVIDAIKQIITNCVLSEIDIENLPIFDIEQIFLQLRAKSVGEVVNLKYRCNNSVVNEETKEEKSCNTIVSVDVNINEILPKFEKKADNKIQITDNVGIVMKYPTIKLLELYGEEENADNVIESIINCIDYIYDKDNVYYAKDNSKEDLLDFIDNLQTKDLDKFKEFFDSAPKLQKNIHFKCHKCGYEEEVLVEGIENFFV